MKMLKILLLFTCICVGLSNAVLYDCFTGVPVNRTLLAIYEQRNNVGNCTIEIKPCNATEWKRVDGSCNNLKHPSRGTHRTPSYRVLPPVFSVAYEPRKAVSGGPLPLPRRLRTELLLVGKASERRITQLASYYIIFMIADVVSIHDVVNYVLNITTCCTPEGRRDYECTPIKIPVDDPVHRYSGVNCMNLTRPQSYQTYGCLDNGTTFERIVFQTPVFDLSNTYNIMPGFIDHLRTYENGLMIEEEEDGQLFPPTDPNSNLCILNQPPRETRCFKYQLNNVMSSSTINILFYRQHNQIARELHRLNPRWGDERLFYTARDINMAISVQIFFYELLPILFGKKNMIRDGIIGHGGFRDLYDENVEPRMSDEYIYGMRWFHLIQKTDLKLYDKDGHYVRSFPLVNGTARTGFFAVDNNMQHIVQGSFRQLGGRFDQAIDYDMADRVLGGIFFSADVAASDLKKGRYFGLQPYVNYKEFCTNKKYTSFEDLEDSFSFERLDRLMEMYKDPKDIDLMAGLWGENPIKGGKIPSTLYCLFAEQLKRTLKSDRHWFERPNRPHAFTEDQLKAIRKVTIAGVLCSIGDLVSEIQPHAFCSISSDNPLTKCSSSKIGKLDLTPWKDHSCQ
ncbi:unnamed protein product [Spodoptera littoralis]|uniref:Uncharacterized protein n=1 Tax=Spodoptera littoralis TaxID=7109 RepID=A0A9P0ID22_SPOLI|nr:unnamed protein product [Spodoptera littoralis]CAH1644592.1 unnamed protein product [Spodoptera littoralis]